jgi:GTP cyclohydrolase I
MAKNPKTTEALTDSYEELLSMQYPDNARFLKKVGTSGTADSLVCEAGIKFSSKRLPDSLPFLGTVDVVYEPGKYVIGFGKIARLVYERAAKLQYQERLSQEIAEAFMTEGAAKGVLVRTRAQCIGFGGKHPITSVSVALGTLKGVGKRTEARFLIENSYA